MADTQAPGAAASLPANTVVAARQASFGPQAGVETGMKTVIDADGDVKGLTHGAKGRSTSGRVIPTVFPDGMETRSNAHARPEIWSGRPGFAALYSTTMQAGGACHRTSRSRLD